MFPTEEKDETMNTTQQTAAQTILRAAKSAQDIDDLCAAGVVSGEFGLTRWGALQVCKMLIKSGNLVTEYDALNVPKYKAKETSEDLWRQAFSQ
tara:strand:- start:414 stop:695 length:282 start_codon:yes stop_codon:yes gene_type:complete